MSFVYQTNAFDIKQLELAKAYFEDAPPKLCLFTNDITPSSSISASDFVEATWTGYARIDLDTWTTPEIILDIAEMSTPVVNFWNTSADPQTAYGWYILDGGDLTSVLAFWYVFIDGRTVIAPGGTLPLQITKTEDNNGPIPA